jgi:hypothetical protein
MYVYLVDREMINNYLQVKTTNLVIELKMLE